MKGLDDLKEVNGMFVRLLPPEIIEFNIEIVTHHPELHTELAAALQGNGEIETYYGVIAAYCGIVLDGAYNQKELVEKLTRALIDKRDGLKLITIPGVVPVHKELLQ
jgi:hypothetical protein